MGVIIYQRGAEKIFPKRFSRYRVGLFAINLQDRRQPGCKLFKWHVCAILFNILSASIPATIRTLTKKPAGSMPEVCFLLRSLYCPPY